VVSPNRVPYVAIGLGYLCLYATGAWLLGPQHPLRPIFGNLGLLIPPFLVCAVIARRRRHWFGCQRLFWDTIAVGAALWMIGHVGWAIEEIVFGRQSWLQWHTVFSLCGGICPLIALFALPQRGVRAHAVPTVSLVLASYGLLSFFFYSYFALIPSIGLPPRDADIVLLRVVQVNRAALLFTMTGAAVVTWRTPWRPAFAWLALATGAGFFLRLVTSQAIVQGQYRSGTLYDLAWIVPFLLYARAALASPESPTEEASEPEALTPGHYTATAAAAIFLIPLIGYGTPYFFPLGGMADTFRTLLTGLMTVGGLGLLAFRLAAQQGQLNRADARIRLLAAAAEQTGDLILIVRASGEFEYANDAFLRATGFSRADLSRQSFEDLLEYGIDADPARTRADIHERGLWRGTRHRRRRDGTTIPVSGTVVGLDRGSTASRRFVAVERDITDELRLRDQLVHGERLSAVGELVAGVAHEINNPLQAIIGAVELMLLESTTPAARSDLELVRQEASRAGHIVRNLLSFVRRGAPNRSLIDLNDLVRATAQLREYHLQQQNITMALELQGAGMPAVVNREEIQQIVLNLLLNAEHAILSVASAGAIAVRTRTHAGSHVIEVADTGPGITEEHRGRIFEPFYTTKPVGEGTGLGLSISHGIASAHGGSLAVVPSPGGACFRLTLPVAAPAESPCSATRAGETSRRLALVVDDEAPIRRLLGRLLSGRGLDVLEADSGAAAISLAAEHPVRLILCDVRMPDMGGVDLYERLAAQDPSIRRRFVFITGDRSTVDRSVGDLGDVPVLEKPFTADDLRRALARVDLDVPV
jgi:PAS domain S-box-containing protein